MSTKQRRWTRVGLVGVLAGASLGGACSKGEGEGGGVAPAGADGGAIVGQGQALYAQLCAGCHGANGEGTKAPSLRDWSRGEEALVSIIDARMPLGNPELCNGDEAKAVAAYILATFKGAVVCSSSAAAPRRLRLLTRREYEATMRELLATTAPAGATTGGSSATCATSFRFETKGRATSSVHVAGAFNGWPSTVSGGGWPLAPDAAKAVWTATRPLAPGTYPYKFVLDDKDWTADPANPRTEPDGQGGVNSVLVVAPCASPGSAPPAVLPFSTAGLPVDTRPEGFAFDNSATARVVTALHQEEYLKDARAMAAVLTADPARLLACNGGEAEDACTRRFLTTFGLRAFRRPLSDAEVNRFVGLATGGADKKVGLTTAMAAVLASPTFLYRSELGVAKGDGTYALTGYEVASALSYSLWGTMPDAALFDAAARGSLAEPAGIEKEARRLLADPRAREALATFATQWLGIEPVLTATKNESVYPAFSPELRASLLAETRAFFTDVVFDGSHRFEDLFLASYTFADERVAKLYGLPGVTGTELRKVPTDGRRAGILGHGSMLATTAHSDQSSPIRRGLFVRRTLLCQAFGAPPPNAGGLPKVDPSATTKERFRQHSSNAACRSCHQYIDELGFGFERFDAVGQYRENENGKSIDGVGDMNDVEGFGKGTHAPFTSLPELARTLAASPSAERCFVETARRYTFGDLEVASDACAVRALVDRFEEKGRDVRELFVDVLLSPDFLVRR